ncbi:hypothetical protein CL616_04950 [archaeon]|nr:hypothetical protein [archaeon]|tara:strand:- start:19 stop:705 length:687 start_codon:yes stop_codon:yes gene_type:complete
MKVLGNLMRWSRKLKVLLVSTGLAALLAPTLYKKSQDPPPTEEEIEQQREEYSLKQYKQDIDLFSKNLQKLKKEADKNKKPRKEKLNKFEKNLEGWQQDSFPSLISNYEEFLELIEEYYEIEEEFEEKIKELNYNEDPESMMKEVTLVGFERALIIDEMKDLAEIHDGLQSEISQGIDELEAIYVQNPDDAEIQYLAGEYNQIWNQVFELDSVLQNIDEGLDWNLFEE